MRKKRLLNSGYGFMSALDPSSILYKKSRIGIPMALYMVFYCVTFVLTENWNRLHYTVIHTAVDDRIPFCEIFIIPYLLWFVYMTGFTLYMLMQDEKSYHEVCTFLVIGMTVFLVVSIFFPNILFLRPESMPRDNILTRICAALYGCEADAQHGCKSVHDCTGLFDHSRDNVPQTALLLGCRHCRRTVDLLLYPGLQDGLRIHRQQKAPDSI